MLLIGAALAVLAAAKPSDSFYPDLTHPTEPLHPSYDALPHGNRKVTHNDGSGSYSYCAMPHPAVSHYELPAPVANKSVSASLEGVYYIQRHQKRTAYHIYPNGEETEYDCTDMEAFQYASAKGGRAGVPVYAQTYVAHNELLQNFTNSTCQFPQLTLGGFLDGVEHGRDLRKLYGDKLGVLPDDPADVWLRSSNAPLTQDSAAGVLRGLYPHHDKPVRLNVQSENVDTHGKFACKKRDDAAAKITSEKGWLEFMNATKPIQRELVDILQFNASDWLSDWDHYNDNLQARVCNGYKLPCRDGKCVSEELARKVFAAGDWMYNYKWVASKHAPTVVRYTVGPFIAEIIAHIKKAAAGKAQRYSHLFMHDGDIAPLAASLGIKTLRWPGMASNIAIELWKADKHYVRVLYSGSTMRSTMADLEWIALDEFVSEWAKSVPKDLSEC